LKDKVASFDTRDDEKINRLSDYYDSYLRQVGYPNLNIARIDPETLMPFVNGNYYTEDTGSGMLSIKVIGYHYSLLMFSLNNPAYYPRFLMLDSPRVFDLNDQTYNNMLLQFKRIQDDYDKQQFQIILTTREIPDEMEDLVIERINSINRMLLRPIDYREQSSPPN
jgi:hypothetical protein